MSHRENHYTKNKQVARKHRGRRLGIEMLEVRRLLAADLGVAKDGFVKYFESLEEKLDESIFQAGAQLPIIGNQLKDKFDAITEKIEQARAIVAKATVPEMILEIESRLSLPAGSITARDGNGGTAEITDDVIIFDFATPKISHTIGASFTFDSTLPSLSLAADFAPSVVLTYQLFGSVGIDSTGATTEFFFDTSKPREFTLDVQATVPVAATGRIGPLYASFTDQGSQLSISYDVDLGTIGASPIVTASSGSITVDSSVTSGSAALRLGAGLSFQAPTASGDVDLGLSTKIEASWDFAGADPDTATATTFGRFNDVRFQDFSIDVGSFVSDLLKPVVDRVTTILGPVNDIAVALNQKIFNDTRLGAADVSYGQLISIVADVGALFGVPGTAGVGQEIRKFLEIFETLSTLERAVDSFSAAGGTAIRLGSFDVKNARDSGSNPAANFANEAASNSRAEFSSATSGSGLESAANNAGFAFPFLDSPIATAIDLLFGGGAARLVTYTTEKISVGYEYIQAGTIPLGPVPILIVGALDVQLVVDSITIAFDTAGLADSSLRPIDGLFVDLSNQPNILFQTIGSIAVGVGVGTGSGAAVAFAGVVAEATLTGTVRGQLREPSTIGGSLNAADQKLRTFEIEALGDDLECALGVTGQVVLSGAIKAKAGARATVPGSVCNKGFLGKLACTIVDKVVEGVDGITSYANVNVDFDPNTGSFSAGFDAELASFGSRTLLEFSNNCRGNELSAAVKMDQNAANLATIVAPSELRLNIGSDAGERQVAMSATNEEYNLVLVLDSTLNAMVLGVSAFGVTQTVFQPGNRKFTADLLPNLLIRGNAGIGDDKLIVDPLITAAIFFDGGDGNDTIILGSGNAVVRGGAGNDRIVGGSGDNLIYGDSGDDIIVVGAGNNTVYGGAGNDRIEVLSDPSATTHGANHLFGGEGNDVIFGGLGNDWIYGEEGSDTLDGRGGYNFIDGGDGPDVIRLGPGGGIFSGGAGDDLFVLQLGNGQWQISGESGDDLLVLTASDEADSVSIVQNVAGFRVTDLNTGSVLTASGIPNVIVGLGDGADTLSFSANENAEPLNLFVDLGINDGDVDTAEFMASPINDTLLIDSPEDGLVRINGLPGKLQLGGLSGDNVFDRLSVHGLSGNDVIVATPTVGSRLNLTLSGDAGDDYLEGIGTLIGGLGDDILVSGDGDSFLQGGDGDDIFILGSGRDRVDGGNGFDTILIKGTGGFDTIELFQPAQDSLQYSVNGTSFVKTLIVQGVDQKTVEAVRIETGDGSDLVTVGHHDLLSPAFALGVSVIGGGPAYNDRLIVRDHGLGDLVVQRLGAISGFGNVSIGRFPMVAYSGVARVDVFPMNSISGGTGSDNNGRLLVIPQDGHEANDSLNNSTSLGSDHVFVSGLSIDPGSVNSNILGNIPGDEDWFKFTPDKIGTYRIESRFARIGTLANGRSGLPDGGELDLVVYRGDGTEISRATVDGRGRLADISMAENETYFIRIKGVGNAFNIYDLVVSEVDLNGPRITAIKIADRPGFDLFATKPSTVGSTPPVSSIIIDVIDDFRRAPGDLYPAILASSLSNGMIKLVGDHSGIIPIESVAVINRPPVVGEPATASIVLNFSSFLPDDRITLLITDGLTDPAGNFLDGESDADTPRALRLPSGNGLAGGDFVARFTVDSRPEMGVISQGVAYIDINGNFTWDPAGVANDSTNRDFVLTMGMSTDAHFSGKLAPTGGAALSNFDRLGVYGRFGGVYSFAFDTTDNGVADTVVTMPANWQVNGIPVAGRFSGVAWDQIGLFDGANWYIDSTGDNQVDTRIPTNYTGLPIVGDFNGDGNDDFATYDTATKTFFFDVNRDGQWDDSWVVTDDISRFVGISGFTVRPVAGDLNLDGIDDIGLFVKGRGGVLPLGSAEWFFWVSDRRAGLPSQVFNSFSHAPLGNDLFAQFGHESAVPIFGNFDPPVAPSTPFLSEPPQSMQRWSNPYDVNGDGEVNALDALVVLNSIRQARTENLMSDLSRAIDYFGNIKPDVTGDGELTPLDALAVLNDIAKAIRGSTGTGGEGELISVANAHDAVFANMGASLLQEEDARKKRRV